MGEVGHFCSKSVQSACVQGYRCKPGRGSAEVRSTPPPPPPPRARPYLGFRSTRMTESPRRNILLMKRSLFTGLAPDLPLGACSETDTQTEAPQFLVLPGGRLAHWPPRLHSGIRLWPAEPLPGSLGGTPSSQSSSSQSPSTHLCPKLLDVLQDHVAVPVEGLHPPQQLPVVSTVDQHLQGGVARRQGGGVARQCARGASSRARTCELVLTLVVSTDRGPVRKSSSSFFSSSSTVGLAALMVERAARPPESWGGVPGDACQMHCKPVCTGSLLGRADGEESS